ncbi:hypothetical protein JT05_02860 [Desulfosporosinus sp. Tol-M]|jgi:hypothetical protein|nr:hypothetical protein JT05_02860 [Desulfosporosinus sp. Tol-M]
MRIPEIVPLTHDLFSSLVELEAQATNRKEKYQKALTELNEHVSGVEMRINQERMTIKGRLSELDQEEQVLQKKIREVTKKKLDASLHNAAFDGEAELQREKARLQEVPQERTAFNELLEDIKVSPEEDTRFNELYNIVREKGQKTNVAMKLRAVELKRVFEVINAQFQSSNWNEGGFSFDAALSSASSRIYKLQKGE